MSLTIEELYALRKSTYDNKPMGKMSIRDKFINFLSGGKYAKMSKMNEIYAQTARPGIPSFDFAPQYSNRTWLGWCYFFEQEVSILSDIASKIRDEVVREGIHTIPLFQLECEVCETRYDEIVEECEVCGSHDFHEPDTTQLQWLKRGNDKPYLDFANLNGQTMMDVLKNALYHLVISDNLYILCVKKYNLDAEGNIISSIPHEFISLDPRDVTMMFNLTSGTMGNFKTCLVHRDKLYGNEEEVCKDCGKRLYPVHFQVQSASDNIRNYIQDEIVHASYYYPSLLYGCPKPLKIADELWSYHYIEKRVRSYYENARANGMLFIPSENQDALAETWDKIMEQVKDDPWGIPIIGTAENAPTTANFIKFLEDPNTDLIEIKEELRNRISSAFGVTMTFINDTSNTGGMKNDKNLMSITDRTILSMQDALDTKVLAWITKQMGITDYSIVCFPHIAENELEKEDLFAAQLNNAQQMMEMDYVAEFHEKEGRRWFSYRKKTAEEKLQEQMMEMGMMGGQQQVDEEGNPIPGQEGDGGGNPMLQQQIQQLMDPKSIDAEADPMKDLDGLVSKSLQLKKRLAG